MLCTKHESSCVKFMDIVFIVILLYFFIAFTHRCYNYFSTATLASLTARISLHTRTTTVVLLSSIQLKCESNFLLGFQRSSLSSATQGDCCYCFQL